MKRIGLLLLFALSSVLGIGQILNSPNTPGISTSRAANTYRPLQYGVFNEVAGLANWRNSTWQTGYTAAGVGLGGVGIVCIGDSWFAGQSSIGTGVALTYNNFPNRLRRMLQSYYGGGTGYGYIPVYGQVGANFTLGGSWTSSSQNGPTSGFSNASGAQALYYLGAPSSPVTTAQSFDGNGVTGAEVVYFDSNNISPMGFDITQTNAFATLGTGSPTGTITPTNGTGSLPLKKISIATGLNPANAFALTLQRASGSNYIWPVGTILYNGNEASGVTMVNFGSGGQQASSFNNSGFFNLLSLCTAQTGSLASSHCTLMITDFGLNEALQSTSPATYQTNLTALWTQATAAGVSVLHIIPPGIPSSYSTAGHANYPGIVSAAYAAAAATPGVTILDLQKIWSANVITGIPVGTCDMTTANTLASAFNSGDNLHPTAQGYQDIARRVFELLIGNAQANRWQQEDWFSLHLPSQERF